MSKYILETGQDINWMGIVPLIIFVIFFIVVLVMALKEKKGFIDRMSNLPLEDGSISESKTIEYEK